MVPVGDVAGRGYRRIMVWLDAGGLPIQASLDTFDLATGDVVGTVVTPCEPFDSLGAIAEGLLRLCGDQLELPLT